MIVGASLAGLRTAEAFRDVGHDGPITIIGDEEQPPYDRPPLSKQVPLGFAPARKTGLPRLRNLDGVEWLLGVAATVSIAPSGRSRSPTGDASTTTAS